MSVSSVGDVASLAYLPTARKRLAILSASNVCSPTRYRVRSTLTHLRKQIIDALGDDEKPCPDRRHVQIDHCDTFLLVGMMMCWDGGMVVGFVDKSTCLLIYISTNLPAPVDASRSRRGTRMLPPRHMGGWTSRCSAERDRSRQIQRNAVRDRHRHSRGRRSR